MRLTTYDVGQASWNLVWLDEKQCLIIDCGAPNARDARRVVDDLREQMLARPFARIAAVIISHLDDDHVSGARELLSDPLLALRIDAVICNGTELRVLVGLANRVARRTTASGITGSERLGRSVRAYVSLLRFIRERSRETPSFHRELTAPAGHDPGTYPIAVSIENDSGAVIWCLAPSQELKNQCIAKLASLEEGPYVTVADVVGAVVRPAWNSASIVLRIACGRTALLLPGDADRATWNDILTRTSKDNIEADVVVAWHHGGRLGRAGSDAEDDRVWQQALKPDAATIVLMSHDGDRRYGHPHVETLNAVRKFGGEVFCTRVKESRAEVCDVASEFPVSEYGVVLTADIGSPPEFYRVGDRHMCCGDIHVHVPARGDASVVACSNARYADRKTNVGCCLNGSGLEGRPTLV